MTPGGATLLDPPHWVYLWTRWGWPYLVFGFALGTIPFGLLVGRIFFHRDIRTAGSGNIGAANALRTFGRKAGIAVLLLDALKGTLAVVVAWHLWLGAPIDLAGPPGPLLPLAGLAAVLGHCYSPWLRFRGGKGVATYLGALVVLSPLSAATFAAVWLTIVLRTGFASLGSMLGAIVAGLLFVLVGAPLPGPGSTESTLVFAVVSAALIVGKHRANIARLRAGTENRLALLQR